MKQLLLVLIFIPFFSTAQKIRTYVIGTTIKESPYRLFTDAAIIGEFKIGQKIWITGIEKEYFRSKDNNGRMVFLLQSYLRNPDSLINIFNKEIVFLDKIEYELKLKLAEEEKIKIASIVSYLNKYGNKTDQYCYENNQIQVGMSKFIFLHVKGSKPTNINSTKTKYGNDEQWVYPDFKYYYFTNDKLTTIQD